MDNNTKEKRMKGIRLVKRYKLGIKEQDKQGDKKEETTTG